LREWPYQGIWTALEFPEPENTLAVQLLPISEPLKIKQNVTPWVPDNGLGRPDIAPPRVLALRASDKVNC
jgi:hypothetical protein